MAEAAGFTLVDARGRKYLTGEERARFLAAARAHPRPTVQTFALTLAHTGCRISEALALRGEHQEPCGNQAAHSHRTDTHRRSFSCTRHEEQTEASKPNECRSSSFEASATHFLVLSL